MATASGTPEARAPLSTTSGVKLVEYDKYIEGQLRKTRRQVRTVDVSSAMLILIAGTLAYLFAFTLVDHWAVTGGLGFAGRTLAWVLFLTGAIAWTGAALLPLSFRRINPVYAAHAIEQSRPSLKNSLVNFLLLRDRGEKVSPSILAAIERQAATSLSNVSIDHAVDRSKLILLGWALLAIVAVCAIYKAVSPKDPLRSFERVMVPWADIAAPTRVVIHAVEPGSAKVFREHFVKIKAQISGLRGGEEATLVYSTADGQVVDQAVPLTADGLNYAAELPPHSGGLQQDLDYWVTAGDAQSNRFHVKMLATPSILVDRITYGYPAYTQMSERSVERQGDLSAIEGTRITVEATANDAIKAAFIDFNCDGTRDLPMQIHDRQASISFSLELKKGTEEAKYSSYQVRFVNVDGEENPKPVRYKIEVTPDLPPEISFTEPDNPDAGELTLAPGGVLKMAVSAVDPDFKLAGVKLFAERNGQHLLERPLLAAPQSGPFSGPFLFDAKSLKLVAGDNVTFWAEAADNRAPEANRVETPHYQLRIVAPRDGQRGERNAKDNNSGDPQADKKNQDRRKPSEGDANEPKRERRDNQQDRDNSRQPGDRADGQGDQQDRDPKKRGGDKDPAPDNKPADNEPEKGEPRKPDRDPDRQGDDKQDDAPRKDQNDNESNPREQNENDRKNSRGAADSQRVDPDADPGKAFDKIINRAHEEQQKQQPNEKPDKDVPRAGPDQQEKQDRQEKQPKDDKKHGGEKNQDPPEAQKQNGDRQQDKQQDKNPADERNRGDAAQRQDEPNKQPGDKNQQGDPAANGKKQNDQQGQEQPDQPQGNDGPGAQKKGQKQQERGQEKQAGGRQDQNPADKDQKRPPQEDNPHNKQPGGGQGEGEKGDQQPGDKQPDGKKGNQPQGDDQQADEQQQPDEKNAQPQKGNKQGEKRPQEGADEQQDQPAGQQETRQQEGQKGQKQQKKDGQAGDGQSDDKPPEGEKQSREDQQGARPQKQKPPSKNDSSGQQQQEQPDGDQQGAPNQQQGEGQNEGQKSPSSNKDNKGPSKTADEKQNADGGEPDGFRNQKPEKNPDGQQGQAGSQGQKGKPSQTNKENQSSPTDESGAPDDAQTKDNKATPDKPQAEGQEPEPQQPGEGPTRSKKGLGGNARGPEDKEEKQQQNDQQQSQDKKGGSGDANSQGDAGAGKPGGNKNGSPEAQAENAPREKKPGQNEPGKQDSDEPESPSQSKKQSDSKGGESGDRSGGGGQGGGQRSNSQGTGSFYLRKVTFGVAFIFLSRGEFRGLPARPPGA